MADEDTVLEEAMDNLKEAGQRISHHAQRPGVPRLAQGQGPRGEWEERISPGP